MAKLWMKKKSEPAFEVDTAADANAAARAYLEGARQVDGPNGERPDDCGCSGEASEPEEVTAETEE